MKKRKYKDLMRELCYGDDALMIRSDSYSYKIPRRVYELKD